MLKKRNLINFSLLILTLLLLTSCFLQLPETEGLLKGQVLVPEGTLHDKDMTGEALPNATVNIIDLTTGEVVATTTTDADGYYQIFVAAGGPYLLEAVKDGMKLEQFTCSVEVGKEYDLGTVDCVTTTAALIAQAMMDTGDNPADIDCAAIMANPKFDDIESIVCSIIKAGGDPTASALVQQAVEDFPYSPIPTPPPAPTYYTVTFDSQDGSVVNSQTVIYDGKVSEPTDPTRTGYAFGGWYKESGCTNIWDFANDTVVTDIIIYAQWNINTYIVTFNKNGGDTEANPTTKIAIYGGNVASLPTEPTRTGNNFTGWNTKADGGGTEFTAATAVTSDITVYAQWVGRVHNITKNTYYTAIQPALDAADSDNIIEVGDGTYDESIVFPSNNIILKSTGGNPNNAIIQGENDKPTVKINNSAEGTKITGFTIKHNNVGDFSSYTISGRGIVFDNGSFTVDNCVISSNLSTDYSGCGIDIDSGTLTLTNSTISGNSTDYGGGGIQNSGILTITNSTISDNSAANWGGIQNSGPLTITNSTISGNVGGGIYNHNSTLTITNSTISGNSLYYGGGILNNGGTLTVNDSIIINNEGSGIENNGNSIITSSTISSNTDTQEGGGINNIGTLIFTDSTISDNIADFCGGGINNTDTLTITGSTISGNFSANCAGIYLFSEDNVIIGGDSDTDFDNFNNFSGVPSDQHIRKFVSITEPTPTIPDPILITIDCHTDYPNNNFTPGP